MLWEHSRLVYLLLIAAATLKQLARQDQYLKMENQILRTEMASHFVLFCRQTLAETPPLRECSSRYGPFPSANSCCGTLGSCLIQWPR